MISLEWFVAIGLAPVSFALAGPLGRLYGARPALLTIGLVAGVVVFMAMFVRGARTPERAGGRQPASSERSCRTPPPALRETSPRGR